MSEPESPPLSGTSSSTLAEIRLRLGPDSGHFHACGGATEPDRRSENEGRRRP